MPVLTRSALEESPLSDLHALASTLGIDGYRRLRKGELVEEIAERQGVAPEEDDAPKPAPRARRSRRAAASEEDEAAPAPRARRSRRAAASDDDDAAPAPRAGRSRRSQARDRDEEEQQPQPQQQEEEAELSVEGVVELLANGSGFIRVNAPEESDEDVYLSATQARRCDLISGDRVGGPVRRARRSERHPSLIRVETINGVPADEAVSGTRLEDLEVDFPAGQFKLGSDDPTLKAIGKLAPFGHGSRVVLAGAGRSGKTEAIKRIAAKLSAIEGLTLELVVAGVRPEELSEWRSAPYATVTDLSFAAGSDAQATAIESAVERGRRIAARGGDAVLLIDTLDGVSATVARRVLAAARNIRDGGSLTIVATARESLGGETTVIAFDRGMLAAGRIPAIDPSASGTIRVELLK
jgi:transcription termination factor Rho